MPRLTPILLCTTAMLVAGSASAQGVLPGGTMPLPPSARETPKAQAPAKPAKPGRKPRAEAVDGADATVPAGRTRRTAAPTLRGSTNEAVTDRIDSRPARAASPGALQLENDPRGVSPIIQNGRAGVGMKF